MTYDELLVKYPKLYSDLPYFECDNGWLPLIEDLSRKLEAINNKYEDPEDKIYAVQVKQKFGGLRFYVYRSENISEKDKDISSKLIDEAEKTSYTVCETCSNPAFSRTERGWITTLCDKCLEASKSVKS